MRFAGRGKGRGGNPPRHSTHTRDARAENFFERGETVSVCAKALSAIHFGFQFRSPVLQTFSPQQRLARWHDEPKRSGVALPGPKVRENSRLDATLRTVVGLQCDALDFAVRRINAGDGRHSKNLRRQGQFDSLSRIRNRDQGRVRRVLSFVQMPIPSRVPIRAIEDDGPRSQRKYGSSLVRP
jgi:hypothetical protein